MGAVVQGTMTKLEDSVPSSVEPQGAGQGLAERGQASGRTVDVCTQSLGPQLIPRWHHCTPRAPRVCYAWQSFLSQSLKKLWSLNMGLVLARRVEES